MNFHRVRRLAEILVASQLRSGRASSDPKSWFGRGIVIAIVDGALFFLAFGAVTALLGPLGLSAAQLARAGSTAAPLVPLVAVAAVLIAGVMFELTTTSKFSISDAANWLPLTPAEYVAGSSTAIAYTYSPAIALFLGGLLPICVAGGIAGTYVLAAVLSVVSLYEGAILVEMVRAITQRAGVVSSGRRGQITLLLRAVLLVVLILVFDLAFNPVILFGFVEQFASHEIVTAFVPVLWSTQALAEWGNGNLGLGLAYAAGQVAFVALLVYVAGALRARFWVPMPTEVQIASRPGAGGHPYLVALGLSSAEAALVAKDLRGFVRRREMLPTLVVPVVLVVLMVVEGGTIGVFGSILWVGWVAGFFALLLAVTSLGQERRSLQALYAYPITAANVLRAKATSIFFPALLGSAGMAIAIALVFRFAMPVLFASLFLVLAGAVILGLWGLAFAARYSDFQDRPRPQYLRPGAMLAAMGSGMVVLFSILVPGTLAILSPSAGSVLALAWVLAFTLGIGAFALRWARGGFDQLFREIPF
jgi:hypothetical protein